MGREEIVARFSRARARRRGGVASVVVACLAVACFALPRPGAAAEQVGELAITSKDFPVEVGTRTTVAITSPEGQPRGEIRLAVIGRRPLGKLTLFRQAVFIGPMRLRDSWIAVGDEEHATYSSFGGERPSWKCPLPLEAGLTYEYRSDAGRARVRVEGPEEVEIGADKLSCLVCVEEREDGERRWTQKHWVSPGLGVVKVLVTGEQGFAVSQTRLEKPRPAPAPEGADVVSTFDRDDPLGSPLFPKGVWSGIGGLPGRASVVDIDPAGGAAGTPFSLRWTYHTKGTWVSAYMEPSGTMWQPVDLSRYGAVSFYVKGLTEGDCALSIRARSAGGGQVTMVHIPVHVTTEWRRVVFGEGTPQLEAIEAGEVYSFAFGAYSEGEAANVVWLDEITLHHAGREVPAGDGDEAGEDEEDNQF